MNHAVLIYAPVLHRGYLDFLQRHRSVDRSCLLIEANTIERLIEMTGQKKPDTRHPLAYLLKKDVPIRGLPVEFVRAAIAATGWYGSVEVVSGVPDEQTVSVLAPDEDVTRLAAGILFPNAHQELVDVRLRYDRLGITRIDPIPDGVTVTEEEAHRRLMGSAEVAAADSRDWWIQVGALIARDGVPLVMAFNQAGVHPDWPAVVGDPRSCYQRGENPDDSLVLHAERGVIARAARQGIALDGADAYVTHFPCVPCASALVEAGIRRVYFRLGFSRLGASEVFGAHGVEIIQVV